VAGLAYQEPAVIPAASARMSLRLSAIFAAPQWRLIQIAALGGVPHRGAVKGAVEKMIRGGHIPAYRMQIRLAMTLAPGPPGQFLLDSLRRFALPRRHSHRRPALSMMSIDPSSQSIVFKLGCHIPEGALMYS
jgi:hypothetical protein